MNQLNDFITLLAGKFDNSAQYEALKHSMDDFPFAEHVNTICNDKISNLPEDFSGLFLLEESYYTTNGSTHASPHLFLFTEEEDGILLTSYELPDSCDKKTITGDKLPTIDYNTLKPSAKFTPALYVEKDGVWEGGSVSQFSPVLTFTLFERFSADQLEVSEKMEVNGKKTFGYDVPILYKRINN